MFIFSSAMCFVRYNLEAVLFQSLTIFLLNKERGLNGFYQEKYFSIRFSVGGGGGLIISFK